MMLRKFSSCRLIAALLFFCMTLAANDVVYLRGKVQMENGSPPGHSVDIMLSCEGAKPTRMITAGKKGNFNLKVERDDFNHIARSLPTTAIDLNSAVTLRGPCVLNASLPGYDSTSISLTDFTINKDMKLPTLVLTPQRSKSH